jgi:hypothetical protein
MLSFLKRHPFAVEAYFKRSVVLTFAVRQSQLRSWIPEPLELDTFQDQWGFIAVALVHTSKLRPKGFPDFTGSDFILAGYRIFVKFHTQSGKRLRGLYILKSQTDKWRMTFLGNLMTHYRYEMVDIAFGRNHIYSQKGGLDISLKDPSEQVSLPESSPFMDWKEARRFAGPLPFTFSVDQGSSGVLIVEGVREHWVPQPLEATSAYVSFIEQSGLEGVRLASVFAIENIPYYWKKGRMEAWR